MQIQTTTSIHDLEKDGGLNLIPRNSFPLSLATPPGGLTAHEMATIIHSIKFTDSRIGLSVMRFCHGFVILLFFLESLRYTYKELGRRIQVGKVATTPTLKEGERMEEIIAGTDSLEAN